jgi:formylglycine-generating enzyme required for sulfatase activity
MAHAEIAPGELVAPKMVISGGNLNFTVQPSLAGRNYQLQVSDTMAGGTWTDVGVVRSGDGSDLVITTPYVAGVTRRFYRLALTETSSAPDGFALILAGCFSMGDSVDGYEVPVHTVQVSAFYMAKYEVTKTLWDEVRTWGLAHGYMDLAVGNELFSSKAANHPVNSISWYDTVKWCNARSQKDGLTPCYYTELGAVYRTGVSNGVVCNWSANGYRLPTEAEWEKAARGGLSGKRFPWGDTITHSQANYYSISSYSYDVSPTRGYHPIWSNNNDGNTPYTSPVGSFAPNGYGLYDMAGNVSERCWDWFGDYAADSQTDPRGPVSGSERVLRGGCWFRRANSTRCSARFIWPYSDSDNIGFRPARGQP